MQIRPIYKQMILIFAIMAGLISAQAQMPVADKSAAIEEAASAPVAAAEASQRPLVLSFMEWKSMRVHEAQQKLEQISKGQGAAAQVWQEGKPTFEDAAKSNEKLTFNVDVALQLNIQDYFSMYLKTLSQEEFKEATKKLSNEEAAELLLAYKNSLDKEKKITPKISKIPKDNAKSKNTEI